jgi:hypothetical protein
MNTTLLIAALAASVTLHAQDILVASSRSNSIEQFSTSGTWLRTFATTGPYAPNALAQSPLTGDIFVTTIWASGPSVGQLTNIILRYHSNGPFDVNWDTFTVECGSCPSSATQSLLFDSSGNLWVATAYGKDLGAPIYIQKYLATDLTLPNPSAVPYPKITAPMYRGNQMAFNTSGNICIAGFIDQDVRCFDSSTGVPTTNYSAQINHSIEPTGLAFDAANRLYLTSVFGGQLAKELTVPIGNIELNENMEFASP